MLSPQEQAEVEVQITLSKSLALGFVFSLLPMAGLGSLAACRYRNGDVVYRGWYRWLDRESNLLLADGI
jgi:hypothetical protein